MKKLISSFTATVVMAATILSCKNVNGPEKKTLIAEAETKKEFPTLFRTASVDGLSIFYREAGDPSKPTILFLHGFPSSSHMYRDIIKDLSANYHLIAPDYPGFGQSSSPSLKEYSYSFDQLSVTIDHFIDQLNLKKITLYLQDYGGPVGFRIANRRPSLVQALVIQNANAYEEGLGAAADNLLNYAKNPNPETEKDARSILTFAATKWQYTHGAIDTMKISPDSYNSDQWYLDRPGNDQVQLSLFRSYASNLKLYGEWQSYFRAHKPHTLVISGKNDLLFLAAGAEAYKKDNPNAKIQLLDGGHFVLEEKHTEAAALIDQFLSEVK
jgi:pimeloyl-ACP methyl ester carboxylesterase